MVKLVEITWPGEYSDLQKIEQFLLCGICYEYLDTAVMTRCSHNFCSLCIRRYLYYKTQCPVCFNKTFENDLRPNRILDEIILNYGKIRIKLASCITGAKVFTTDEEKEPPECPSSSTPVRPARVNRNSEKSSPKIEDEPMQSVVIACKDEEVEKTVSELQNNVSSPSTSNSHKVAKIFTPKSKKSLMGVMPSEKTVSCPACGVTLSETLINRHLDNCLKQETATQLKTSSESERKPLPKLVFALLKDIALRRQLKSFGLPTHGNRTTLEKRYVRYRTLYNAECDKKEPRSIEELLKQCENDENMEEKMHKFAQAANRLQLTHNSAQNVIEEAQKKYLEDNRQSYQELITGMKARQKNGRQSVRRTLINENGESFPEDRDVQNHSTGSEDDPVNYSMNACGVSFQDSDSDSSYPLQHYTSDHPTNYLSIDMVTSDNSLSPTKPETSSQRGTKYEVSPANDSFLIDTSESSSKDYPETTNVYCASTDKETSDDDSLSPTLHAATSIGSKRAKFSFDRKLKRPENASNLSSINKVPKLAMSITRDLTVNTSGDENSEAGTLNEKMQTRASGKSKKDATIPRRPEKENDKADSGENESRPSRITSMPVQRNSQQTKNPGPPLRPLRKGRGNIFQIDDKHK